jgi:hypothetical protein
VGREVEREVREEVRWLVLLWELWELWEGWEAGEVAEGWCGVWWCGDGVGEQKRCDMSELRSGEGGERWGEDPVESERD